MLAFSDTPTRLPSAPRVAHRYSGPTLWLPRLIVTPHICIGIGMMVLLLVKILTAAAGTDTTAVLTSAYVSKGSKGSISYHVSYGYTVDGRDYAGSDSVSQSIYDSVNRPEDIRDHTATIRVRSLSMGPIHYDVVAEGDAAWRSVGSFALMALFWNAVATLFAYQLWIAPYRLRWLIQHGIAAPGVLVSRRIGQGKRSHYYVTYRFQELRNGREFTREMLLPGEPQFEVATIGRAVTVIYDPRKPKRSVVYELSGYRVDGAVTA